MKFLVHTTDFYKGDAVIKHYPCLNDYHFNPEPPVAIERRYGTVYREYAYITINSIEELTKLMKRTNQPLIIGTTELNDGATADYSIEIYDNYRE